MVTQDVQCRCSGCCWEGGVLPRRLATPNNIRGQRGGASASHFCSDLTYLRCRRPKPGGGAPRPSKFPSGAPWVMCWLWMSLMAAPHPPAKCQSAQVCGKVVCYSTKHSPNGALCGKWPLLVLPHSKQPQGDHMGHLTGVVSHFVLTGGKAKLGFFHAPLAPV